MKSIKSLAISMLLIVSVSCAHQESNEIKRLNSELDSLIQLEHKSNHFQGGIVITKHNEIVYENYIGIASREQSIPISSNTKFDMASVNKSFTAALVLKAVEDHKLSLEDKLVDLLKDFAYSGYFHPEISIHQLLSHTSGLPDYSAINNTLKANNYFVFKNTKFSNAEYVEFISHLKPISNPAESFYYSNFGYHLLAIILETTYQQPFDVILRENLTQPLGLKHTVAEMNSREHIKHLADSYLYNPSLDTWEKQVEVDLSLGRRIFSTVYDLNRWGQVMSNPGYLSKTSLNLMKTNHLSKITKEVTYGYGWVVFDDQNKGKMGDLDIDKNYIVHGGSTDGFKAMLVNINESEYVISFLSNHGYKEEILLTKKMINLSNI